MLDVVVAAHIARTPSGEIIVDPRKHQIVDGYSECTLALMPNQNQVSLEFNAHVLTQSDVGIT